MMDGTFMLTREIVLNIHRCSDCAHWWACEKGSIGECPICADRYVNETIEQQAAAGHRERSLRGVITRWKNRWHRLVEWEQQHGSTRGGVCPLTLRAEMRRLEGRTL